MATTTTPTWEATTSLPKNAIADDASFDQLTTLTDALDIQAATVETAAQKAAQAARRAVRGPGIGIDPEGVEATLEEADDEH